MIWTLVTVNVALAALAIWGLVVLFKYFPREGSDSFVFFESLECYLVKGQRDSKFAFVSIPVTNGSIQLQLTEDDLSLVQNQNGVVKLVQFPVSQISRSELTEKFTGSPIVLVEDGLPEVHFDEKES